MELPDTWTQGHIDPSTLSDQAIEHDQWDISDLAQSINTIPPFAKARRELDSFVEKLGGHGGRAALNDGFWSLLKAEPTLEEPANMRPDLLVNRKVAEEMLQLDALKRLRFYSVNDDVQAALSTTVLEPELEVIFDQLKGQQDQADQLQKTMQNLFHAAGEVRTAEADADAMMASLTGEPASGGGDSDGEPLDLTPDQQAALDATAQAVREAQEALEALQAQAQDQADELEADLADIAPTVSTLLDQAVETALDDARATHETSLAWGLEPGQLQRMNAQERMELAKRLNNPRFKAIADRFGPMRNMMFSEQARKSTDIPEEMFDIETGNHLPHLLPSELLLLSDEDLEWEFFRRFAEKGLMQYAFHGEEKLARGGIIFCEDGSGSMSGDREMWAKAVMLCLLHLARQQKRTMHVLHFGSPGQIYHMPFVTPEDFTLERILEAAEMFFCGGTCFTTPMKSALKILQDEFSETGGVKADVVFITDDECWVDSTFMTEYLDEMHRMDATTWGVTCHGRPAKPNGALHQMSEGKVCEVRDFATGGDMKDVFRSV